MAGDRAGQELQATRTSSPQDSFDGIGPTRTPKALLLGNPVGPCVFYGAASVRRLFQRVVMDSASGTDGPGELMCLSFTQECCWSRVSGSRLHFHSSQLSGRESLLSPDI